MVWLWSITGIVLVLSLFGAMAWGMREIYRATSMTRLERRLNPSDVMELDRAFARIQRDVLFGD